MNSRQILSNSKQLLISFGITMFVVLPARALLKGDPELLRMTAKAQKENRDRIESWQGRSQVESILEDSNGVMQHEKSLYDFAFSREHDATLWKWTGKERFVREGLTIDGIRASKTWAKDWSIEMRKGNAFCKYGPGYITKEGQRRNTLVILPREKAQVGVYSYSFDPMWYLTGPVTRGGDDLTETLLTFYRRANDPKFAPHSTLKVERDGNLVIFETGSEDLVNRYTFDLSKGGSVVKYYAESKSGIELREWTYEQKEGIWIPKTFIFSHQRKAPDAFGRTKRTRKVNFVNNILNQPIPASEFSLKALGLKDGERISDQRTERFYIYNEKNCEELSQELFVFSGSALEDKLTPEFMEPLIGKPLPEIKNLGVDLLSSYTNDKSILVCFFDVEQRPSRNCILQLSKKANELKSKDVVIVGVHASKTEQAKLDEWIKENEIDFLVGVIESDEERTRFDWGVKSLPWLILTDIEHIVTAEGFSINELDGKIATLREK